MDEISLQVLWPETWASEIDAEQCSRGITDVPTGAIDLCRTNTEEIVLILTVKKVGTPTRNLGSPTHRRLVCLDSYSAPFPRRGKITIMNKELQVLCDVHRELMTLVGYKASNGHGGEWQEWYYHCNEAECSRHFSLSQGYLDMVDGRIDRSRFLMKQCPERHDRLTFKAIVAISSEGEFTWQCLRPSPRH